MHTFPSRRYYSREAMLSDDDHARGNKSSSSGAVDVLFAAPSTIAKDSGDIEFRPHLLRYDHVRLPGVGFGFSGLVSYTEGPTGYVDR